MSADTDRYDCAAGPTGAPTKKASWRNVLKIHPAADLFPLMSSDELKALGEDIKANGMKVPVVLRRAKDEDDEFELVDGRNRLDALEAVGINVGEDRHDDDYCDLPPLTCSWRFDWEILVDEVDPYAFVISANIHRRHLTTGQKRELVAKVLKAQPASSDRAIANVTKVSDKTVGAVRRELEGGAEIPHLEVRTGTNGQKQPRLKKTKTATAISHVTTEYPKVAPYEASPASWQAAVPVAPDATIASFNPGLSPVEAEARLRQDLRQQLNDLLRAEPSMPAEKIVSLSAMLRRALDALVLGTDEFMEAAE
jgi:hypothetical protein